MNLLRADATQEESSLVEYPDELLGVVGLLRALEACNQAVDAVARIAEDPSHPPCMGGE